MQFETSLKAYAKLTLSLQVTGIRDDGYHLIDSEMVSLDLADDLYFEEGSGLEISGEHHLSSISDGPDNLVSQALLASGRNARVRLYKRIPIGAGLGGGSSNAAAVLRWAKCFDTDIAVYLGADVPFCLRGGHGRVRGVGEIIEQLPFEERLFTLLVPPMHISTAEVYRQFDLSGGEGTNHLQSAALTVEPRLEIWQNKLRTITKKDPILAGSGGTWFVEGAWEKPAEIQLEGARWIIARTTPPVY